jgi:hypothetical protein
MSLGSQLIEELSRRRKLGMYFDFVGYRELRKVSTAADLHSFLSSRGYRNFPQTINVSLIADRLAETSSEHSRKNILVWLALDPLGGLLALPFWLVSRVSRTDRQ